MEKTEIEKRKELQEEKLRQQFRLNSPELREFHSKLLRNSVNKHLGHQMAEKKAQELEKKVQDQILAEKRGLKQQQDNYLEQMKQISEYETKRRYSGVLKDQLSEKRRLYNKGQEELEQEKIKVEAMRLALKEECEK